MDLRNNTSCVPIPQNTVLHHGQPTPSPSPEGRNYANTGGLLREYIEVWDYAGGARFRGFVAEKNDMRSMFIFFDQKVVGMDLKQGYDMLQSYWSFSQMLTPSQQACVVARISRQ